MLDSQPDNRPQTNNNDFPVQPQAQPEQPGQPGQPTEASNAYHPYWQQNYAPEQANGSPYWQQSPAPSGPSGAASAPTEPYRPVQPTPVNQASVPPTTQPVAAVPVYNRPARRGLRAGAIALLALVLALVFGTGLFAGWVFGHGSTATVAPNSNSSGLQWGPQSTGNRSSPEW